MKKKRILPLIIYLLVLSLAFSWIMGLFDRPLGSLAYSEIVSLIEEGSVKSFVVQEQMITLELHEPLNGETEITSYLADPEGFRSQMWETLQAQRAKGTLEGFDFLPEESFTPMDFVLPLLLAGGVLLLIWFLMMML